MPPKTERLSSFWVPSDEAKRFARQVPHGERGIAQTNLFLIMQKATEEDRKLWQIVINNPDRVEIRRRETFQEHQ